MSCSRSVSWDKTLGSPGAGVSSIFCAITWPEDKTKHNKQSSEW